MILTKKFFSSKFFVISLIFCSIVIFLFFFYLFIPIDRYPFFSEVKWGVTFSARYAKFMGLDDRDVYKRMFKDFNISSVRIPVYWDEIEVKPGIYNFKELDWQMDYAHKQGSDVILAVGYKVPRWPECYKPEWILDSPDSIQPSLLQFLRVMVDRYKDHPALFVWQVENEPLFQFGNCVGRSKKDISEEITFVRELDPSHKILVTDSGELGSWFGSSRLGSDYFGFTTYRIVHNPYFGYFHWWFLSPEFYRKKSILLGKNIERVFAMEVQAEPWLSDEAGSFDNFSKEDIRSLINFIDDIGFERAYLWGVEWWYHYEKVTGDSEFIPFIQQSLPKK